MFWRVAIILSVGLLLLGFTFVENGTRFVARGQTTADGAKNSMSLPRYRASVVDLASDEMEGREGRHTRLGEGDPLYRSAIQGDRARSGISGRIPPALSPFL